MPLIAKYHGTKVLTECTKWTSLKLFEVKYKVSEKLYLRRSVVLVSSFKSFVLLLIGCHCHFMLIHNIIQTTSNMIVNAVLHF